MQALIAWTLGILAASATSQTVQVSSPIESVTFCNSSDRVIVKCPAGTASYDCFAIDVNNQKSISLGNFRSISASNDGTIAAGCKYETRDVYVINLLDGRQMLTGLKGDWVVFDPAGHRFAVQNDFMNASCAIDLFDPDSTELKVLSRFATDILSRSKDKYVDGIELPDRDRIGIMLTGWTEEGLELEEVIAHHTGMRGDRFIVDLDKDKAHRQPKRSRTALERRYSIYHDNENSQLLDRQSGNAVMFSRTRNATKLAFSLNVGPYKEVAKKGDVMVVGGITDDRSHAEIWVVNTRSYKAKRLAVRECPFERKPGYQNLVISPDGKWVAYRDFADPRKLNLIRVSNDIAG